MRRLQFTQLDVAAVGVFSKQRCGSIWMVFRNPHPKDPDSQMNKEGSKQENMNKSAEREGGMTNGWWVMTTNKGNGLSMMGNKCFAQSVGSIAPENGALCPWHTEH